jgi:hypothetical protein
MRPVNTCEPASQLPPFAFVPPPDAPVFRSAGAQLKHRATSEVDLLQRVRGHPGWR